LFVEIGFFYYFTEKKEKMTSVLIVILLFLILFGMAAAIGLIWKTRNPAEDGSRQEFLRLEQIFREGFQQNRQELGENLAAGRQEQGGNFRLFTESNTKSLNEIGKNLSEESRKNRQETLDILERMQQANNQRFAEIREAMDQKIREIREQNAEKLEDMRKTVDEKLQKSVEHHFNESFNRSGTYSRSLSFTVCSCHCFVISFFLDTTISISSPTPFSAISAESSFAVCIDFPSIETIKSAFFSSFEYSEFTIYTPALESP
jgi:hypothetical protein